jgi:hypothetical protein
MRQFLVLLVSVTTVVGGTPLRASSQDAATTHRHYILRANPQDAEAIASRHGFWIERSDLSGSPVYYVGSPTEPATLIPEVQADAAVVSFEEDRNVAVPESDPAPTPPPTDPTATPTEPAATAPPATDPAATTGTTPEPTASSTPTEPSSSGDQAQSSSNPALDTSRDVPPTVLPTTTTGLPDTTPLTFYGTTVWTGFKQQPAATILRNDDAHRDFGTGAGVVAVIDSGIDLNHPALQGTFVEGYDFLTESTTITSDTATLQQSTAVILEYSSPDPSMDPLTIAQLNQSTAVILEQSTAVILESQPLPSGFGHGTMVAGLVHLVAPTAKIMPLRVFQADGTGEIYNVVRAIYYAVDHGATVINMSFSLANWSDELVRALNYASNHRVVLAASAGNAGKETVAFPAGFRTVLGVGSTDSQDRRSTFSNFGKALVRLSAPGRGS